MKACNARLQLSLVATMMRISAAGPAAVYTRLSEEALQASVAAAKLIEVTEHDGEGKKAL